MVLFKDLYFANPFSELKVMFSIRTIVFSFLCIAFIPVGNAAEIVVNKSVLSGDYSLHKIRAIFTMKQRFWPNGEIIKVYVLADNHPIHKKFTKTNLNMFPHQLRRVWNRMVFSGTGQAPVELNTEEEMLEKIANVHNAIGYLENGHKNEQIQLFANQ